MPTVLITGITAYLSVHTAVVFLKNGWNVRGTLRSDAKRAAVLAIPELAPYLDRLQLVVTGDLSTAPAEAYAEAVKGVDAVAHLASPVEFEGHDFQKIYLQPALQGTRSVLEAAAKEESIRAVVMTSSYAAMCNTRLHARDQVGHILDHKSWNPDTIEELTAMGESKAESNGVIPAGVLFYFGAKKFSEKEAWDIKQKTGAKWSFATINPAAIFGPTIAPIYKLTGSGMSTDWPWAVINNREWVRGIFELFPYGVDVRDIAEGHYQAIVRQANGRFPMASQDVVDYQRWADIARTFPELKDRVQEGTPGVWNDKRYTFDASRSIEELGIKYRPFEETARDSIARLLELEKQGLN